MRKIDKIGLVGGGQMAEALVRGMIVGGVLAASDIMIAEPDLGRREHMGTTYKIHVTSDPGEVCDFASIVILAVKPQIMPLVLESYKELLGKDHLVISIAAGVTIRAMEAGLSPAMPIVRVMPNTPALVLAGVSALSGNAAVSKDDMAASLHIFSAVGECVEVAENLLDAVTGLSGSGPGYVFTFIEAMIDGGVLAGIPRPIAEKLAMHTVFGSAKLGIESGEPAAVLKGKVTSPGGTTIEGLRVLEAAGMRGAVMNAIDAATRRSRELGK
ncbi:MAG: pyrroline-5-carboxylate reductase [Desulfobulbaceae bacterium]|nr:pyrroline-5-carboxylate reductase [Desulfobulbaceae bacterium]